MTRHLHHVVVIAVLLWATWPVDAKVFKYEDENGNIVFSDTPPDRGNAASDTSNREKKTEIIEISEPNSFQSDRQAYVSGSDTTGNADSSATDYSPVEISSPQEDASIRENSGNITVVVAGQTSLLAGHKLVLILDGKATSLPGSGAFTLTNLDRGTHVLRVDIMDRRQKLVLAGIPRTFHLQRFFVKK